MRARMMPRKKKPSNQDIPQLEAWEREQLTKELHRRLRIPELRERLLSSLFPQQRAFAEDPSRLVVAHPGRRAGKTYGVCVRLAIAALSNPGGTVPFVHKTLTSGSANMGWKTFRSLDEKFGLGLEFRTNPLRTITFPGGGQVWFVGADKEDQIEKLRGDAYPEACIDEAGTYRRSILSTLIDDVISPALVEYEGALVMAGTPSYVSKGAFYEACTDHLLEASVHHWTMLDNPHIPNAKAEIQRTMKRRLWDEDHPVYRREYMGHWVFEKGGLVYRSFDAKRNDWDGVLEQEHEKGRWRYVLGIDYGFSPAPTAFAILAYDTVQPRVRVIKTFEKPRLIHTAVAAQVERLSEQYNFDAIVVDAAHPELIEALNQRGGVPAIPAEKVNKMGYIEILNDEFATGVVLVDTRRCKTFVDQAATLPLSDNSNTQRLVEDKSFDNHSCHVPGTLVCVNGGRYIPIEDVRVGDTVLTAQGNWKPVLNTMSRPYKGKIVRVGAAGTENVLSTPEHEYREHVYARCNEGELTGQLRATGETRRTRADQLQGKSLHYATPVEPASGEQLSSFVDGYYLAEGSSSVKAGIVQFAGHEDETQVEALVKDWATSIRTRKRWAKDEIHKGKGDGKSRALSVYNRKAAERYSSFGVGTHKHHPDLQTVDFHACLEGYLHGDGHLSPAGIKASSVSRELAYQVAFMARCLGYKVCVCRLRRAGRYRGFGPGGMVANDSWQVCFTKASTKRFLANSYWPALWKDKTSHPVEVKYQREQAVERSRVRSTDTVDYEGTVYTLEVEDDHTYTVNGVGTYNCDALLYSWRYCHHFYSDLRREKRRPSDDVLMEQAILESVEKGEKDKWWEQPADGSIDNLVLGPWWDREDGYESIW